VTVEAQWLDWIAEDATGQEWMHARRLADSASTVSLALVGVGGPSAAVLGMAGWLADATLPALPSVAAHLGIPIRLHMVAHGEGVVRLPDLEGAERPLYRVTVHDRDLSSWPVLHDAVLTSHRSDWDNSPGTPQNPRGDMGDQARAVARQSPAVAVDIPDVPPLTENALENVRALFALTVAQVARVLGVTERQVYRTDPERLDDERRRRLDAMVALGLLLVGGLGPEGARRWLDAGDPSGWELVDAGDFSSLRARAEQLTDSIAT
jgi:hypothetical protein